MAQMAQPQYEECGVCYDNKALKLPCCNNFMCDECKEKQFKSDACENQCPFCRSKISFVIKNDTRHYFVPGSTRTLSNTVGYPAIIGQINRSPEDFKIEYEIDLTEAILNESLNFPCPGMDEFLDGISTIWRKHICVSNIMGKRYTRFTPTAVPLKSVSFKKTIWSPIMQNICIGRSREQWKRGVRDLILFQGILLNNYFNQNLKRISQRTNSSFDYERVLNFPLIFHYDHPHPTANQPRTYLTVNLMIPNPFYYTM
jgi:hypothetical protein